MTTRFKTIAALVAIGLVATAPLGISQTVTATLTGTANDASGAAIPNASVVLTNELSGDTRKTTTNTAGYYSLPAIPTGAYTLTVEAGGFQKSEIHGIVLNTADQRNVNVALQVGTVNESVEVSAGADSVETVNSGAQAQTLNTGVLQNIGIVGRSAAEFLKILPGMASTNGVTNAPRFSGQVIGINGSGNAGSQSAVGSFSANGTPTASTEITSDGAHTSDPGCNCATPVNPNPEMLQEVHVLQTAFGAENAYGPVVINTVTKAGGTQFHGELYDSIRNYALNANDAHNNALGFTAGGAPVAPRPPYKFNFPGANIGGPVLIPRTGFNKNRDKLFFFSGFEYFGQKLATAEITAVVPTAAMRAGNFSAASLAALGPAVTSISGGLKAPNSTIAPGGVIPTSLIDPGGQALMNLLPMPNANPNLTGGYNYEAQLPYSQNGFQLVERVDYSISDSTKLFIRYYHQHEVQNFPISMWGGGTAPDAVPWQSPVVGNNHSESAAANLTHVFTPSLTNEFVAAFTYIGFANTLPNPKAGQRATVGYPYQGAFKNGDPYIPDFIIGNTNAASAFVNMAEQGGFDIATAKYGGDYFANKPLASIGDNVTKIWGAHTLRFGIYTEDYGNIQPTQQKAQGQMYTTANNPNGSGNPFADLLLGDVATFNQYNYNINQRIRSIIFEWYAQDSWKMTRHLTLEYGMRFQHDPEGYDLNGNGHAAFVPSAWTNNPNALYPGFEWHAIDPSIPNEGYPTRPVFFSPRFGGAWDVFGNGSTVVRGGIGDYRYRGPSGGGGQPIGLNIAYGQKNLTLNNTTLPAIEATTPFFTGQNSEQLNLPNPNSSQLQMVWTDNFGITQRLPWSSTIEAAYVNTMGRHLPETFFNNYNPAAYGAMLNAAASANSELYRPYPNYYDIVEQAFDGYSDYNALQVTFRHSSSRYLIQANYTYSKATGDTAIGTFTGTAASLGDSLNPRNDHGALPFDRRQTFNFAYSVNLPGLEMGNRFVQGALNGWTASGIMQIWSGANLQGAAGATDNEFGFTLPAGYYSQTQITGTPDVAVAPVLSCNPTQNLSPGQYLNPNCFALPTPGHNGSFLIPEAFGPGFFNADLSLFKTFKFGEKRSLQFRAEGFNFLNHPNRTFGYDNGLSLAFNAQGQETNTLFGTPQFKTGNRLIQFVAKFYF